MPTRKIVSKQDASQNTKPAKRTISFSIPTRFTQQQVLYTLLLVAAFLVGYLIATVQYLKKPASAPSNDTAAAPQAAGQAADPNKRYDVKAGHFPPQGENDAKVKIVAFADFRCPFCEKFFTDVEPQIIKDYVDTGKAQFSFRHYQFLGPASVVAGNAAECANDQGKFWEMYNYLFENQPAETDTTMYTTDTMSQAAGTLGMDQAAFKSCMDSKKFQKNVDQDMTDGQAAGVSGTPTFFINGKQLVGAQPYESFKAIIDQELQN